MMQGLEIELEHGIVMGLAAHVGISLYPDDGDDPETLIENATIAWEAVPPPHGGVGFFTLTESSLGRPSRSLARGAPPIGRRMGGVLVVEDCPDTRRLIDRALGIRFPLRLCDGLAAARGRSPKRRPIWCCSTSVCRTATAWRCAPSCAATRRRAAFRDLPSARNAVDTKVTAFGLGADDFVDKPFDAAELRARVGARLRRSRSSRRHSRCAC